MDFSEKFGGAQGNSIGGGVLKALPLGHFGVWYGDGELKTVHIKNKKPAGSLTLA